DSLILANEHPYKKYQISFVAPLGNQGLKGLQQEHQYSLNVLVGKSAALKGLEVGGLGNIESDYVEGAQFAGLFNLVGGNQKGLQAAGLFNVVGKTTQGSQLAGLINLAGVDLRKKQKDSLPVVHPKSRFSSQLAGFINADLQNKQNLQVAGFMNVAQEVEGVQASGFMNVSERVKGTQISGFLNLAQYVEGSQVGLFNVSDSIKGVPIGLLSIVRKNGFRHMEFWGNEAFHANLGLKIGVRQFYNIFVLGSNYTPNSFRWGLGYGFGTQLNLRPQTFMNVDLIAYHVNEDRKVTRVLNLLNTLKVTIGRRIGRHFSIFGGPSFNALVSDFKNSDNSIGSQIAPWTFYETSSQRRGTNVKLWFGVNLGVRF
ncbi:MAG: hypothetical protein AAFU64_12355, partial [Bacteroidota bacterium]